jgi:dihydrofolate synthase/folylpolyglutamate synthase
MRETVQTAEVDWLYGLQHFGVKLGLDNIRGLLEVLGRPDRAYPSVLIGGTNGKGSVGAMLQAMLSAGGLRTGLFTSPHLMRLNERIRIAGRDIEDGELVRQLGRMRETIAAAREAGKLETHPSFFEVITATALQTFRDEGVELGLLEVGLGGRLDATNAVDAMLSVVVSVDLDHTKTLGPTVAHIAYEKGGIVKPGRVTVSGVVRQPAIDVLRATCAERGSTIVDALAEVRLVEENDDGITLQSRRCRYPGLRLALAGRHQLHNARVAVAAFEQLAESIGIDADPAAVREGLATVRWDGRLQWICDEGQPNLLLDGAHNPAGARTLAGHLERVDAAPPVALFGVMHGKLLPQMIEALGPRLGAAVITRPSLPRAEDPEIVAEIVRRHVERVEVVPDPAAALERARALAGSRAYVLVTGSLYLVGEILSLLRKRVSRCAR